MQPMTLSSVDLPEPLGDQPPLVRVENVSKHFGEGTARVDALREVSLRWTAMWSMTVAG